ncbi:flagellar motor protein [Sphingomonas sp. AP4-R1]|uniref:MotA/TolQ/ExbB proton channel family protein n=1 Tax=Sphingomonas sp. AP4-R1 TaxID=2735134 RepID=UPI001493BFA1|nr:MotA/TolQ/ExbB proton channel family protein [Sphingomonas sp. AP4-R1]QJU56879.1 flagellar motor protein [Sphingomonas sp. AP4-R1]
MTILAWLDPLAFALVVGGALLVASLRATRREIEGAFAALRPLLRADPEADAAVARAAVSRVHAIVETKSIVCVDRVATTGRFLAEAIRRLSDARSSLEFTEWADEALDARRRRHAGVVAFWRAMADTAPAMGMIATVIGLIRMFRQMADATQIGAPMASALVATLLGLIVANLFAGPIADRLERLSEAELAWQERTLIHFKSLARAELDQAIGLQRSLARSLSR